MIFILRRSNGAVVILAFVVDSLLNSCHDFYPARPSTRPSTRPPHSPSNRSSYVLAASFAFVVVVLVAFVFFIKSRPEVSI